jgi:hypothetical protein
LKATYTKPIFTWRMPPYPEIPGMRKMLFSLSPPTNRSPLTTTIPLKDGTVGTIFGYGLAAPSKQKYSVPSDAPT